MNENKKEWTLEYCIESSLLSLDGTTKFIHWKPIAVAGSIEQILADSPFHLHSLKEIIHYLKINTFTDRYKQHLRVKYVPTGKIIPVELLL